MDFSSVPGARVATRLQEEEIIWLTTVRADGRPQSVPVWALWDGETFLIYSKPDQPKTRNIAANPRVSLNLNSNARGGDIVRIEGMATVDPDAPTASEVPEYIAKYGEPIMRIGLNSERFAKEYSVAIRVTPTRWVAW